MYNNHYTNMQEPRKYLLELGLSDSEVTVYLAMMAGARTARDLIKITRMKRPTVYYALGCLEKRGLISKTGQEGDKRFFLEPLKKLIAIAKEKSLEMSKLQENIEKIIPSLESASLPINQKPVVAFFEGVDAVKNTIMEMLYCKSKKINSIAPKQNFFQQHGIEFVELFIEERARRGIKTKNLWDTSVDKKLIKQYYEGLSEVRILPEIMKEKFSTTIFLYDNKTLYISSIKNSYCVLITSKEHHDTMQALFDGLWISSKPHEK
jgi:sugar-specific transcriptional regulator TrmB